MHSFHHISCIQRQQRSCLRRRRRRRPQSMRSALTCSLILLVSTTTATQFNAADGTLSQPSLLAQQRREKKTVSTDELNGTNNNDNDATLKTINDYTREEIEQLKAERKQKKKEKKRRKKAKEEAAKNAEEKRTQETVKQQNHGDVRSNDDFDVLTVPTVHADTNSDIVASTSEDDKEVAPVKNDDEEEAMSIEITERIEPVPPTHEDGTELSVDGEYTEDNGGKIAIESISQDSEDKAKLITHDIDGYGTITSCDEEASEIGDYKTIDLEISFEYEVELISVDGKQTQDMFQDVMDTTERNIHNAIVDAFLHCDSFTQTQGMSRQRSLRTDAENYRLLHIIGVSSAPRDTLSLSERCTPTARSGDTCMVINAATLVTVIADRAALEDASNSAQISTERNSIRTDILNDIESTMSRGVFDKRYGRSVFANISFLKPAEENVTSGTSMEDDATATASLREETHSRQRRRGVRCVVIVGGICLIILIFKMVAFNKKLRLKGRPKIAPGRSAHDSSGCTGDIEEGSKHIVQVVRDSDHAAIIVLEEDESHEGGEMNDIGDITDTTGEHDGVDDNESQYFESSSDSEFLEWTGNDVEARYLQTGGNQSGGHKILTNPLQALQLTSSGETRTFGDIVHW